MDPLTVYLVTAEPGDAVWERFGHNGIWISNGLTGEDLFWEWGIFSFTQEGFIPRLARGTMLYSMGARYLRDMLRSYASQDRRVWAQELRLTPEQERRLQRFVRNNAQAENRDYIYDYYTDNCSTRARDALDVALGGTLQSTFGTAPANTTWRWHTRRLLRDMPLAEAGVQIVLGNPGDAQITAWQEMFLPMKLRQYVGETEVTLSGATLPLVVAEHRLLDTDRPAPAAEPAARVPVTLLLGLALGGALMLLGRSGSRRRTVGILSAGWMGLVGAVGLVLVAAWVFTDHDFWRWNENLFLFNPVYLAGAVLAVPLALGRDVSPRLGTLVRAAAGIGAAGLALKVLPGLDQGNLDVAALVLPVNLALAWVLDPTGRRVGSGRAS